MQKKKLPVVASKSGYADFGSGIHRIFVAKHNETVKCLSKNSSKIIRFHFKNRFHFKKQIQRERKREIS